MRQDETIGLRAWIEAKLETVEAHFIRIDKATELLDRDARQVPTELQTAISGLSRVFHEQLDALDRAIDKQDIVNKEVVRGLEKSVDDLKDRLSRAEARQTGAADFLTRTLGWLVAAAAVAAVVVAVLAR